MGNGRVRVAAGPVRQITVAIRRLAKSLRILFGRAAPIQVLDDSVYAARWDAHARALPDAEAVGGGSFELIGRIELGILVLAGLRADHTIVDLGCGAGRLAMQVIPMLNGHGHYVGMDVSAAMLDRAQARVQTLGNRTQCRVSWLKLDGTALPLADESVDLMCAFSVFTHIEHEDAFRYLKDARRVVRSGGRFIYSCLTMNYPYAFHVFLASAADDVRTRWSKVRNVTTSADLMDAIARLAGWTPLRWYHADEPVVTLSDPPGSHPLGQSVCVLESPPAGEG